MQDTVEVGLDGVIPQLIKMTQDPARDQEWSVYADILKKLIKWTSKAFQEVLQLLLYFHYTRTSAVNLETMRFHLDINPTAFAQKYIALYKPLASLCPPKINPRCPSQMAPEIPNWLDIPEWTGAAGLQDYLTKLQSWIVANWGPVLLQIPAVGALYGRLARAVNDDQENFKTAKNPPPSVPTLEEFMDTPLPEDEDERLVVAEKFISSLTTIRQAVLNTPLIKLGDMVQLGLTAIITQALSLSQQVHRTNQLEYYHYVIVNAVLTSTIAFHQVLQLLLYFHYTSTSRENMQRMRFNLDENVEIFARKHIGITQPLSSLCPPREIPLHDLGKAPDIIPSMSETAF